MMGMRAMGAMLTVVLLTGFGRAQIPEITAPPQGDPPPVEQPPRRPRRPGPPRIACWAISSNGKAQCGYYVGGGSPFSCGQPRCLTDGTWGWDYRGCFFPQRVMLLWTRHRHQGGVGAYKSEGPHLLPLSGHEHRRADP